MGSIQLRGIAYRLAANYSPAITAFREVVELLRTVDRESADLAMNLNSRANAERESGDLDAAERDYQEALAY